MSATGMGPALTGDLFARAARVTPGGVHSPVRAFRSVGLPPLSLTEAHGAKVRDADGREFVDWIGGWGPALLGHGHPDVVAAIERQARRGLLFVQKAQQVVRGTIVETGPSQASQAGWARPTHRFP